MMEYSLFNYHVGFACSGAVPLRRQERVHRSATRATLSTLRPGGHGDGILSFTPLLYGSEHHVRHGQQPVQQVNTKTRPLRHSRK